MPAQALLTMRGRIAGADQQPRLVVCIAHGVMGICAETAQAAVGDDREIVRERASIMHRTVVFIRALMAATSLSIGTRGRRMYDYRFVPCSGRADGQDGSKRWRWRVQAPCVAVSELAAHGGDAMKQPLRRWEQLAISVAALGAASISARRS